MSAILSRLQAGDVVTFKNEDRNARFRKVLGVVGSAVLLSSASKTKTGSSLNVYFVTMTPTELGTKGYTVAE